MQSENLDNRAGQAIMRDCKRESDGIVIEWCDRGNNIIQAAILRLAQATTAGRLFYLGDLVCVNTISNPITRRDEKMHVPHLPDIGVYPVESALGETAAVFG